MIAFGRRVQVSSLKAWQVLVPVGVVLLACAFLVSPGLFNIDEFVDYAGARAFLTSGSFTVPNGLPQFSSPDLNLWILVAGPHGLAPQYPVGLTVVGAPLLAVFGTRGLMLINLLAGIGTLFALWPLARRHFGGTTVALLSVALLLLATFWVDYLFGVWPHAVSVLCVTVALLSMMDGLRAEPPPEVKTGLIVGAAIGFGLMFRTDTILALPGLGLAAILFAKRPFRLLTFVALALAPFVALTSAANYVKFGTINPLSYGQSGGNTDLATHVAAIAALAGISLLLLAARFLKWRPGGRELAIGLAAVALVVVFSATARDFLERYLTGAWALLADSRAVQDPRPGVHPAPGGLLSFWGMWKKALGQSMPWLGLLFLGVHTRKDEEFRRSQWVVLIFAAVWSLPFFVTSWHGGVGGNMRYFLPLVPPLCALSARYLIDFARPMTDAPRILIWGGVVGAAVITSWVLFHPTREGGAQQIVSTWILLTVVALALLSGVRWRGQGAVRVACLGAIGAGLAASFFFMANDIKQTQSIRALTARDSAASAALPDRALVYAPPTMILPWALKPTHLAAMPDGINSRIDYALVDKALAEHYRVLVWEFWASGALRARYGARLVPSGVVLPDGELLEIKPAAGGV